MSKKKIRFFSSCSWKWVGNKKGSIFFSIIILSEFTVLECSESLSPFPQFDSIWFQLNRNSFFSRFHPLVSKFNFIFDSFVNENFKWASFLESKSVKNWALNEIIIPIRFNKEKPQRNRCVRVFVCGCFFFSLVLLLANSN